MDLIALGSEFQSAAEVSLGAESIKWLKAAPAVL